MQELASFIYLFDWSWLLLIPAVIISCWAQIRVKNDFKTFSQIKIRSGLTGHEVSARIMRDNALSGVSIHPAQGEMTDNYNPRDNSINLSNSVYDRSTITAAAVAAHETGHAIQHASGYAALNIRTAIFPVVRICSQMALPLIIIGFLFSYGVLIDIGIYAYTAFFVFQVVTLPVEFNASKRALQALKGQDILYEDEMAYAKRVLTSAALTYVAAAIVTLLQVLRLALLSRNR